VGSSLPGSQPLRPLLLRQTPWGARNNPTVGNAAPDQAQPSHPIPIPGRLGYAYAMVGQHRVIIEMSTMRVMRFLD
jgi:hypothetical protein